MATITQRFLEPQDNFFNPPARARETTVFLDDNEEHTRSRAVSFNKINLTPAESLGQPRSRIC